MAKKKAKKKARAKKPYPWEEIRLRYVTGEDQPTCRQLSREYEPSESAISRRLNKEGWKKQRKTHRNRVVAKARKKIEDKQSIDLAKSIRILEGLIAKMVVRLNGAGTRSIESLAREIRETIKTLNVYLDRPAERIELTVEERASVDDVLDWMEREYPDKYKVLEAVYSEKGA